MPVQLKKAEVDAGSRGLSAVKNVEKIADLPRLDLIV